MSSIDRQRVATVRKPERMGIASAGSHPTNDPVGGAARARGNHRRDRSLQESALGERRRLAPRTTSSLPMLGIAGVLAFEDWTGPLTGSPSGNTASGVAGAGCCSRKQ